MIMDAQGTSHSTHFLPMKEYASDLARRGARIIPGASGTYWAAYESGAIMRIPTLYLKPPSSHEVREMLWSGRITVASYVREPDEDHPANAWLYLCADQTYALEKLAPPMRRNVRRGLAELTIAPLSCEQLLTHGAQAFCDTRRRVGQSDGTPEEFRRRFTARSNLPEVVFLGAWKDNQLAAFLSITQVDDWVEIDGNFSMDALRQYRPSDTLMYYALSHYLVEQKCRVVNYGLSSIQVEGNAAGLHKYKIKVGFEARPVHRAFVLHPLLRPFANRLTLWGIKNALRFRPENRRLKKARAVLACMFGDTSGLEAAARETNDA